VQFFLAYKQSTCFYEPIFLDLLFIEYYIRLLIKFSSELFKPIKWLFLFHRSVKISIHSHIFEIMLYHTALPINVVDCMMHVTSLHFFNTCSYISNL